MKRILAALLTLVMMTALLPAGAGAAQNASRTVRLAIMTDLHFASLYNHDEPGDAQYNASQSELRLMHENDMLLDAALREAGRLNPDALLISGDMTSNGELGGAEALARKLRNLKTQEGFRNTGIYVVNGNHDMNNSYAADFTSGSAKAAARIEPGDFRSTFSDGLGYGKDDHWAGGTRSDYKPAGDDPYVMGHHGSLSYAADIADGVTLIVLDTAIYRSEKGDPHYYNEAQQTPGYVSDDLLQWAVDQTLAARKRNNLVLVMAHHALIPHYSTSEEKAAWFMDNVRIPNWEQVTNTLADAGAVAVLTGHSHVNDISMHVTPNNNVFYDIETASISAYPCSWRSLEIRIDGEGDRKSYAFSVQTHEVQTKDLQGYTGNWYFKAAAGNRQKFDSFYGHNIQKYAYDRTGITQPLIRPGVDYNIKGVFFDIFHTEGGLAAYIRKKLALRDGETVGGWVQETMRTQIDNLDGLDKDITLQGYTVNLKLKKTGGTPLVPRFEVILTLSAAQHEEHAELIVDLEMVKTAVDNVIDKAQAESAEGTWRTSPYGSAPLTEDLAGLLAEILTNPLATPLEGGLTALDICTRAYQGYAYGDEAKDKAQYDRERALLRGDKLREELVKQAWAVLLTIDDDEGEGKKYPAISSLLQEQIAENSLVRLEVEGSGFLLAFIKMYLDRTPVKYLSSLVSIFKQAVGTSMNPIPASAADLIINKVADLHETMTYDANIPQDREWTFRSVLFDANGGTVSPDHGVTDGNHRLAGLPTPERYGYNFAGWYDARTGGKRVTPADDMSGTGVLYARWTKAPAISVQVTFRVLNGMWNDGTTAEKTVRLTGYAGDELRLAADDIPAAGARPAQAFREGAWDTVPDTKTVLTKDTLYTYAYIPERSRYTVVSVQNREHVIGSGKDTVITVKRSVEDSAAYGLYTGAAVDGTAVPKGGSSAAPGSLILTLKSAYLDTLKEGEHQVGIHFRDGKAATGISVVAAPAPTPAPTGKPTPTPTLTPRPRPTLTPEPKPTQTPEPTGKPTTPPVPKTGDSEPLALWIGLVFLAVLGLGSLGAVKRRR